MTPVEAESMQAAALARMQILVWTVRSRGRYFVLQPSLYGDPLPQTAEAPSVGALSAYRPAGLDRWARFEDDDPAIVETWL